MSADGYILPLAVVSSEDVALAGGKGCHLAMLTANGFAVPETLIVTARAYRRFVEANGLEERILLELNRKAFADMRWEEIWDAALRIRNLFLRAAWPSDLGAALQQGLASGLADGAMVIRSSATSEDSAGASFAGLHESYVNIRGGQAVLDHVRKVWASLWSDAALLYRQELGLSPARSDMAVLIQELVVGDCSGVAFSVNPLNAEQSVVEAVPGLNQGLVDGMIRPERWILNRGTGKVIEFAAGDQHQGVFPAEQGTVVREVTSHGAPDNCLAAHDVARLFTAMQAIEACFDRPQDIEWTRQGDEFIFLQARPVTATVDGGRDQRGWYLSLRRSFKNLCQLRRKIEDDLIPQMIHTADELSGIDLSRLSDEALAAEIDRRGQINQHWSNIYYADFIPFAHGARLFGQVYNDALKPEDPHAFVALLTATPMESLARNRHLEELATMVRADGDLAVMLRHGRLPPAPHPFRTRMETFMARYGDLSSGVTGDRSGENFNSTLVHMVLELANAEASHGRFAPDMDRQMQQYLDCFHGEERQWAADLLDLARASYRLRDDDNIHLGRIEAQLLRALRKARTRIDAGGDAAGELAKMVARYPVATPEDGAALSAQPSGAIIKARQLVGQPAGPGLAQGRARVVHSPTDLRAFRAGEILICDAVDPNMTFVVPLAAGIVERRGGMLIHGAIIAREYGLPCVTGVPEVMRLVVTGDAITVDGYLGIVIVGTDPVTRSRD
jgi:pyruvate,water dikinase